MLYLLTTNTCFGLACAVSDAEGYKSIYQLKKRSAEKPIAIMVPDFEWLEKYTVLTTEQIQVLKNYPKPFSVLTSSAYLQEQFEKIGIFNGEIYQHFSLRVAHTSAQQELINQIWPLFLTSANLSGDAEIYTQVELEATFSSALKNREVIAYQIQGDIPQTPPSEIFAFKGKSLEQIIFRPSA